MVKSKKIMVVVSGGFDPVHIGHIRLFQEAKKLGDELVVILNNDNWLKNKRGHVFMPEKERKEILESIAAVDRIFLTRHRLGSKNRSVCRELERLKPDIFANGGDRFEDNIPEVAVCNKIGCQMVFHVGQGGKVQSSSWLLANHQRRIELDKQAGLLLKKKMIVFDLDGTLTKSKTNLDKEMSALLRQLLEKRIVGVMGGGSYPQFKKQFLSFLKCPKERLKDLFLLPTCGGRMYKYQAGKWQLIYEIILTAREKRLIFDAFKKAFQDINYIHPKKTYGEPIEDRETQVAFSALGQRTPLAKKEEWNKKHDIRPKIKAALEKYLPQFEVRLGGLTSIDVTKKGIDKAYGIRQIRKILSIPIKQMVYIGDALYEGGNDYAVLESGIDAIQISDCEEVKYLIRKILS